MTLEEYNRERTIEVLITSMLKAVSRYKANYGEFRPRPGVSAERMYFNAAQAIHFVELIPTYGWPTERVEPIRERQP